MQCRSDIGKSKLFYDFAYEVHCGGNVPFFLLDPCCHSSARYRTHL